MKFLLLVLFTVTILNAQNIEGEILDAETSEPIEYVNVFVKEQKIGGVSDSRGKFKIVTNQKIAPSQAVFFTILGYHPVSYSIADLKKRNFTIYLNKSTEVLNEVTMSGNRKRKPNIAYTKLAPLIKG
ncbi:MAG: carboxypeptidase-like regulatory domain-containing protein, partial [Maribacter stanieri]